jgi:hypothetical protein
MSLPDEAGRSELEHRPGRETTEMGNVVIDDGVTHLAYRVVR